MSARAMRRPRDLAKLGRSLPEVGLGRGWESTSW